MVNRGLKVLQRGHLGCLKSALARKYINRDFFSPLWLLRNSRRDLADQIFKNKLWKHNIESVHLIQLVVSSVSLTIFHGGEPNTLKRHADTEELTQVYARQVVLLSYFLCPEVFLHCNRVICSTFDGSIVRNNNTFNPIKKKKKE